MPKDENFERIVGENYGHAEAHLGHEAYQAQVELTESQTALNKAQLDSAPVIAQQMRAHMLRTLAISRLFNGIAFLLYMLAILAFIWTTYYMLGGQ